MNKIIIVVAIVVVIIIAAVSLSTGFIQFKATVASSSGSVSVVSQEKVADCLKLGCSGQAKIQCNIQVLGCVTNVSIQNKDAGYCFYAPSLYVNGCYKDVAIALKDITICDKFTDPAYTKTAKNWCYEHHSMLESPPFLMNTLVTNALL